MTIIPTLKEVKKHMPTSENKREAECFLAGVQECHEFIKNNLQNAVNILPIQLKRKFKIFPLPLQWWVSDCSGQGKNFCKTTWWYVLSGKHKNQNKVLGRP